MNIEFERTIKQMGTRNTSMRGVLTALMFERTSQWVYAQELAEIIKRTPTLGARGGVPCEPHHVMAKLTAGIVERRLEERNCDYRLIIDPEKERLALVPKVEEKAWRAEYNTWYVSDFSNSAKR